MISYEAFSGLGALLFVFGIAMTFITQVTVAKIRARRNGTPYEKCSPDEVKRLEERRQEEYRRRIEDIVPHMILQHQIGCPLKRDVSDLVERVATKTEVGSLSSAIQSLTTRIDQIFVELSTIAKK